MRSTLVELNGTGSLLHAPMVSRRWRPGLVRADGWLRAVVLTDAGMADNRGGPEEGGVMPLTGPRLLVHRIWPLVVELVM
jgi:hypothetical protein